MSTQVVSLGAWCDVETEDEARQRRLAMPADGPSAQDGDDGGDVPRPGRFVPLAMGVLAGMPDEPQERDGLSFRVEEFAVLADGRRIRLHAERGWSQSGVRPKVDGADPWQYVTLQGLEANVRNTVLPDDAEETGEDHPWEWLCQLLLVHGIEATPEQLQALPYVVEFSDRLHARVASAP